MSDKKSSALYALSKDTTSFLNSMLGYTYYIIYPPFEQILDPRLPVLLARKIHFYWGGLHMIIFVIKFSLIYRLSTYQSTSCDFVSPNGCSFCPHAHLSLCLLENMTSAICFAQYIKKKLYLTEWKTKTRVQLNYHNYVKVFSSLCIFVFMASVLRYFYHFVHRFHCQNTKCF